MHFQKIETELSAIIRELSPYLSDDDVRDARYQVEKVAEYGITLEFLVTKSEDLDIPIAPALLEKMKQLADEMGMIINFNFLNIQPS